MASLADLQRRALYDRLTALRLAYQREAEPIIKELARIAAREPVRIVIMNGQIVPLSPLTVAQDVASRPIE